MAATAPLPTNLAAAMRYGPDTNSAIRRSQYLTQALQQLNQAGGQNIRSPGELAAKLVAAAILNRQAKSADAKALGALRSDMDTETSSLLSALRPNAPAPAAPQAPPQVAPQPPPAPLPTAAPAPQAPPTMGAVNASPQDRDALTRMLATEAIGEGPQGMAAAGHVALNRLKNGHGGAKSLSEVVYAPHQFEGMSRANQVKPEQYAQAQQVADAILSGQLPDPTNGAVNFINPELQMSIPGRSIPAWAQGPGQRIGRHVFFGGQPGAQAQQAPQMPVPPQEMASLVGGPGSDTIPPSEPARSPADAGTPPAAQTPQASVAGGNPQWPTYRPSEQEIGFVQQLLSDPRRHEEGVAEARKLQQKMTQPVEASIQMINGAPFYVPKTPGEGPMIAIPVPPQAMTNLMSAQDAGLKGAPQGLNVTRDPLGNLKEAPGAPPQGYGTTANGYAPIQGGPADPMRPQAPAQGYQYQGTTQAPIQGGPADPKSPQNLITGEGKLRDDYDKQIQPYIQAREGYQKVVQAAKNASPAGDIALVFGYMKTLDPGSTVREGEQATVQNSGTIDQTVSNVYNRLVTGQGRLSPEQRAQFATSARNQFEVYQRTADAASQRYADLAKSYGYAPERIVRQFDAIEPFKAPASIPEAARRVYEQGVQAGKINPRAPVGSQAHPFIARDAATLQGLDKPQNRGKFVITPDGAIAVID